MKKELTCSECILLILRRGGRWRNKQIEHAILETYGIQFQSNTIAKFLSFHIKAGKVDSDQTNDKTCYEYWIVQRPASVSKVKMQIVELPFDEDPQVKIDRWMKIAATYPHDHPQLPMIMAQINTFEAKQRRMA